MRQRYKEIINGVIPAIIFMVIYKYISFSWAVITGFGIGLIIYIREYIKYKKLTSFSYLGIFGLVFQTMISLIAKNPKTYFIYSLISNLVYAIIFGISLIIKKDIISFCARDMCETEEEFHNLKPAFRTITAIWFIFFILRTIIKAVGFMNWSFETLYIINWILGTPVSIILIWYSFEYPVRYYKKVVKGD